MTYLLIKFDIYVLLNNSFKFKTTTASITTSSHINEIKINS